MSSLTSVMRFMVLTATLFASMSVICAEPETDHPLVSRYKGSKVYSKSVAEFDEYRLITGVKDGKPVGMTLEGKVTRFTYTNPPDRSSLEILRNYQQALTTAGMTILFSCKDQECGDTWDMQLLWQSFNGLSVPARERRYLCGEIKTDRGDVHIALLINGAETQLDIVEGESMEEGLVAVNVKSSSSLAQDIDQGGRASVYGIYFDYDKSIVKPESRPALDEVADLLLKKRPALKLYVVGHTDMSGDFRHNLALSEARAKAVANALVEKYRVAGTRLEAHGVGPLAPAASNAGEQGKAKNRRVELVAR